MRGASARKTLRASFTRKIAVRRRKKALRGLREKQINKETNTEKSGRDELGT